MTQSKIEGKFYPLQHEEWLRACRELTPAELKCLYYIRTSDPYSNGVRLTAAAIARDLSCEGQPPISRQTISRAIKRLDQLGYIEMEPLEFNVKISGKGVLVSQHTDGVSAHHDRSLHTNGVSAHHDRSSHTTDDRYTPPTIATHQPESETVTQQEFCKA
jgi:DNA-binding MarR family transcriptional regulator